MATYSAYRHVELDGVGCGKRRITKPPGGDASDIFNVSPTGTPPTTPRRVKNYMASTIFSPVDGEARAVRQRPNEDSFGRLFGAKDVVDTPKKNHQKSNIVFVENGKPIANGNGHGSTGSSENGSASSSGTATPTNGLGSPKLNGHGGVNGNIVNGGGHENGTNGMGQKRIPPGGFSSKLW